MQTITLYLRADNVKATLVDEWNQKISTVPAITRGMNVELVLKLLGTDGQPLPAADLAYDRWDFVVAHDWNTATPVQIHVASGITVQANEVHIPLLETNTLELIAALGTSESLTFGCELIAFAAESTTPDYILQFPIVVRNRRSDVGTLSPTPVAPGSFVLPQVDALRTELVASIATKADATALETLPTHDDLATKADVATLTEHTSDQSNPHKVTAAQVGAVTQDALNTALATKADATELTALQTSLAAKATRDEMTTAIGTRATKTEVETLQTDLASKATKAELTEALAEKAGVSALAAHTSDQSNPHKVTAAQVGAVTQEDLITALTTKANLSDHEALATRVTSLEECPPSSDVILEDTEEGNRYKLQVTSTDLELVDLENGRTMQMKRNAREYNWSEIHPKAENGIASFAVQPFRDHVGAYYVKLPADSTLHTLEFELDLLFEDFITECKLIIDASQAVSRVELVPASPSYPINYGDDKFNCLDLFPSGLYFFTAHYCPHTGSRLFLDCETTA